MTLKETIVSFLQGVDGCVASLKEINKAVEESDYETTGKTLDCSIRTVIYRNKEFLRVAKGLYMLKGEETCSLLINGDSRALEEVEDESVDAIITDHPWSDTKAHTSGNQKGFAQYETFCYTQEDFNAKARVLKEGSYLVEFLPIESATNWEYLSSIKEMAKKAGFEYYASCIWRKAPEGTINNGRTTKGVEQFLIFSKGKARRLAPKGKPYMTKNMLSFEVNIPIKASSKNHQAEKPLELYKYLIENLTEEKEVCLDQFGGACNLLLAAVETKRYGIVYELAKEFVQSAVKRMGLFTLFEPEDMPEMKEAEVEEMVEESVLEFIPAAATEFQLNFLRLLEKSSKKNLLSEDDWKKLSVATPSEVNKLFNKANALGYAEYQRPIFDIDMLTYQKLQNVYAEIDDNFEKSYDAYTRAYYENVRIENQCYAEYKVIYGGSLQQYLDFIKRNYPNVNVNRTEKILSSGLLMTA